MAETHFHVMGVCREHGPTDIEVLDTMEEIYTSLDNALESLRTKADPNAILVDNGRTKESVDFIMHQDGASHNMLVTWRECHTPKEICQFRQMLSGLQALAIDAMVNGEEDRDNTPAPIITDDDQSQILEGLDNFFKQQ